jgi:hypothetical protein
LTTDDLELGYGIEVMSPALPDSNGGHWVFAVGDPKALLTSIFLPAPLTPPGSPPSKGSQPARTTRIKLGTTLATVYFMPPFPVGGLYGGHVVVQWSASGTSYQFSLHGYTNIKRAELMAQALMVQLRDHRRSSRTARVTVPAG